ncbi:hypothetical protein BCR35DRAFT_355268 [Leucosporidium creatinivorum]|uniref:CSD domain-containing protein n=1 Tax=Leucosporidium creatinivorum TaxID=106004 RepID=A0A1Y2DMJ0_9BASI|nr:hypothetical protein BCR35DRAFT_355268 [Leucosporidium creatinivorum]
MVSSLPGSPRRANTPTSSKATKRIAISTTRRHSFSGAGLEEALTKELTNLVRCTPRNTTVTLVVELKPGEETPSGESDDKAEGSSSDASRNSIVELDSTSEDSLQSELSPSIDAAVKATHIAEVEVDKPASRQNDDRSLHPTRASPPTKAASAPPAIQFNPYLANAYAMGSAYGTYPSSALDPYYDYQLGSAYHTRFPSYATTSDGDYPPMSPTPFLPTSPPYSTVAPYSATSAEFPPSAASHSQAPLPWTQHHYSPNDTYDFVVSHAHQQLYYNPSATGMSTPPSPPDLLFPGHFPRRSSHDSSVDSTAPPFSSAAWDRQEMYPAMSSPNNSVLEQLERGEVMRRSGVTKFFDMQKGFGFIVDDAIAEIGGRDIFVHYTAILMKQGFRCLHTDEAVEYDLVKASSGGFQALNVSGPRGLPLRGIGDAPRSQPKSTEPRESRPPGPRRKNQSRALSSEPFLAAHPQTHSQSQSQSTLPFPPPSSYKGSIGSPPGAVVSLPTPNASRAGSGTTTPQLKKLGAGKQKGGA